MDRPAQKMSQLPKGHPGVMGPLGLEQPSAQNHFVSALHGSPWLHSTPGLKSWGLSSRPCCLLCGSEATAISVTQRWLRELQDVGTWFVEELGGTAQQSLGLSEGACELLQPLCKLGVTLQGDVGENWGVSTHLPTVSTNGV